MKWLLELLGLGGEIVKAKTDLKRAKIEAETKAVLAVGDREGAWEKMAAQNAANSWADEFWTVILSIPLIMAFIPWLQPFVTQGFTSLETVPEWYRWSVLAAISFAFARKKLPKLSSWRRGPKA